jgi:predicted RNase H-like nuclease
MPPTERKGRPPLRIEREVFAGIDLAWGQRARTGLAVVSAEGALLASASVRSDAEIGDFLAPVADELATVAVDAPLIVTNPTGQRPCEREIGVVFGRYGAGAYPANTSNQHFNPPRAATLAAAFGWNTDPGHAGRPGAPTCIEVYPHPAMVGLFSLPYTLPYKGKKGRDLARLQAAYEVLLDSLERHLPELALSRTARWDQLRTIAAGASRKADLERIEDEIDAILCAHLAWLWSNRPQDLRVYGDVSSGYIVAPPPPTHSPEARRASLAEVPPSPAGAVSAGSSVTTDLDSLVEDMVTAVPALSVEQARLLAERARQHFQR